MKNQEKLFIYTRPIGLQYESYQLIVGRSIATYLNLDPLFYSEHPTVDQFMLAKLIGLAGEGRVKHLFIISAEVLSNDPMMYNQYIKHFRDYQVELYFGVDILPRNDKRFQHILYPKFY